MTQSFSIPELFALAENIRYQPGLAAALNTALRTRNKEEYELAMRDATKIAIGYESVNVYTRKDYGTSSILPGTPLFQPLLLKGVDSQDDLLLESAVLEVSQQKNIVVTPVQGRDNAVKEFINGGDWNISVSGIICAREHRYPLDEVIEFEQFMQRKATIQVVHELLNVIGVYEIVILDHKLSKSPHINCQAYSFTAVSDEPTELVINDAAALDDQI
jgi:hypothetical protein